MTSNIKKNEFIEKNKTNEKDCGSSLVQISLLSLDIENLTNHLKRFKKDNHSKTGLIKKVNLRKKLLQYLKKKDKEKYQYITKYLNIRK